MTERAPREETEMIQKRVPASQYREQVSPIYLTSSFTFEDTEHGRAVFANERPGFVYSRFANPSVEEFEEKMCALEDADAGIAVASGMAAVFTPMAALLNRGDHVLACRSLFSSTHQLLTSVMPRWGIEHTYADILDPESWEALFRPNTRLCIVETPSNPSLDVIDLEWLGGLCRAHGVIVCVDNVLATPILQKPMHCGADLVVHSATKYLDGQGRFTGGIVVGKRRYMEDVRLFARHTGPTLSPFTAWNLSRSLETLPMRMERHSRNTAELADWLFDRPDVERIMYPHHPSHPGYEMARKQMKRGGGMLSFIVQGGFERGRRFMDALEMITLTPNLGDVRSIATHPASTTHSSLSEEDRQAVGIPPGLIRLSIGLEHVDDIVRDVEQALDQST